ncbi:uncharacterized protein EMPS_06260 [Entomortierella parvispora]|uniref:HCP-like protein n=1 Tax=Entomortierella parvispora TaxID=205924 RepID=A0A9P3HC39_9FUNG|nr:uncharacterized protein EMPS_06260 [Entomortierella parvispora]
MAASVSPVHPSNGQDRSAISALKLQQQQQQQFYNEMAATQPQGPSYQSQQDSSNLSSGALQSMPLSMPISMSSDYPSSSEYSSPQSQQQQQYSQQYPQQQPGDYDHQTQLWQQQQQHQYYQHQGYGPEGSPGGGGMVGGPGYGPEDGMTEEEYMLMLQQQQPPVLSHDHLRPGHKATLLSYTQTLELYRQNAKKTNDPELQFEFAAFMIDAGKDQEDPKTRAELFDEAMKLLRKLATNGHAESQHYLAECFASGFARGKPDFDKAFPLWVQASKHGHPDAAYRTGRCYDEGLGTRKDSARAVQFYRKASSANHPGAMWRLGVVSLYGELGLTASPRDGVKWLKRSAQAATPEFPFALYELAQLHERGIENIVFVDPEYSITLYTQAAELGHAPSAFRLGECWEYGKLGVKPDPRLSIHYYTLAAQEEHPEACFALAAWYLVGSEGVLPQSDAEAYIWAKRAADKNLAKALYALGYFTEVGIGPKKDLDEAIEWYKKAAAAGDKRATQRLEGVPVDGNRKRTRGGSSKEEKCSVM